MKLFKRMVLSLSLFIYSSFTFAAAAKTSATIETIVDGIIPQLESGLHPLLFALAYIFGIFLGYKGVLKLKEVGESKGGQQGSLAAPIALICAAALCFSLPVFINFGISTLDYDKGGQSTFKY